MNYERLFDAFFAFGLIGWVIMAVLFIASVSYSVRQFGGGSSGKAVIGVAAMLTIIIFSASAAGFFFLKNQATKSGGKAGTKAVVEQGDGR